MEKIVINKRLEKGQVKVLVVDDSALVRTTLKDIFQKDRRLKVIGVASDPFMAAKKIRRITPDVITLDIEMPRMDGLTFLKKIMNQHPIPVVVISSLTAKGTETGMRALEYGAVEIVTKPQLNLKGFVEDSAIRICDSVVAAAGVKNRKILQQIPLMVVEKKNDADVIIRNTTTRSMIRTTEQIVVIGASTGGTEAIKDYLEGMPENGPGTVIVQHMPEHFTRAFAQRMNDTCKMTVKEAENGDSVIPGQVLIAPGNHHLLIGRSGTRYYVHVTGGPLVNRHRPSVDVLFRSAAMQAGKNAMGIIMTGMGDDGARGMLEMKEAGAYTIAQDERSSVVFGMPKEAIERNAVKEVLPLSQLSSRVLRVLRIT